MIFSIGAHDVQQFIHLNAMYCCLLRIDCLALFFCIEINIMENVFFFNSENVSWSMENFVHNLYFVCFSWWQTSQTFQNVTEYECAQKERDRERCRMSCYQESDLLFIRLSLNPSAAHNWCAFHLTDGDHTRFFWTNTYAHRKMYQISRL